MSTRRGRDEEHGRRARVIDASMLVEHPPFAPSEHVTRFLARYTPSYYLDVGSACPLRCAYCCVPRGEDGTMTRSEDGVELRRAIEAASALGLKKVALLGGEPAIRKDLFELVDAARGAGCEEIILTSKSEKLARPEFVERLVAHGVTMVHISLDAFDLDTLESLIGDRSVGAALVEGADLVASRRELSLFLYAVLARANLPALEAYVRAVAELQARHGVEIPVVFAAMKVLERAMRARDEILPPMRDSADAACRALELGERLGVPVMIRHVPTCLLGEHRASAIDPFVRDARFEVSTRAELPPERDERHGHVAECAGCEDARWCPGPQKAYVSVLGSRDFGAGD